jgi:uncharacterized protein (DUF1015 family)
MNILPFRGYRYAVAPARDISSVAAPPYDQISPEMQDRLFAMSAHNVVRLTLPKDEPSFDKYHRAQQVLEAWLADGVWAPEQRPAIYPYHQTYRTDGRQITRVGFVTLGEVTDYTRGVVRPHERTHAGPKQDRLRLLEATGADIGLLFMLTSDPEGALLEAVHPRGDAVAEAHDLRGELHQLWRITDDATIARVQALMSPRSVIIADGHHRYETAVDYARRHPAARYKLMAFFTLEAPGLTILANHRLVHDVEDFSLDRLVERARAWFDVSPLPDPLQFTPTNRSLGMVSGSRAFVLRLRDEALPKVPWPPETSRAWRALAVSVLHEGLLKPLLDITEAKLDARSHVDYTADAAEAVRLAREGRSQAAFLIAPTTAEELRSVVEGGELLPQKSTHFYPKLLDGLVFHRLQEG